MAGCIFEVKAWSKFSIDLVEESKKYHHRYKCHQFMFDLNILVILQAFNKKKTRWFWGVSNPLLGLEAQSDKKKGGKRPLENEKKSGSTNYSLNKIMLRIMDVYQRIVVLFTPLLIFFARNPDKRKSIETQRIKAVVLACFFQFNLRN